MYNMMTIINTTVLVGYSEKLVKRLDPKSSHHKKKIFFFLCLPDVSWIYSGDDFTIYVNQVIMLYTLNLYSGVGQLYIYKTGKYVQV